MFVTQRGSLDPSAVSQYNSIGSTDSGLMCRCMIYMLIAGGCLVGGGKEEEIYNMHSVPPNGEGAKEGGTAASS